MDEAIRGLPDSEFQEELRKCEEHSLVSERELRNMKKTMVSYVQEVGRALEKRFSNESFYADQCSFIEPLKRNFQKADIKQVLQMVDSGSWFNVDKLERQYKSYLFDGSLDFLFTDTCDRDITRFFLTLVQQEEFSELARLALLLLTVSPDSVACERGFSVMNYVKNEYRTSLAD